MSVYQGKITEQFFTTSKNGAAQFVMMVELNEKLNGSHPSAGVTPCEPRVIDARLSFSPGKATEISIEALEHMGFTNEDIGMLSPETPGFFDLKGKKILVKESPTQDGKRVFWNYYIPFAPKITPAADIRSTLGSAYRETLLAKRAQPAGIPF